MSVSGAAWVLLCWLACCSAAGSEPDPGKKLRILGVFGHLGKSHFDVFKPLLEELARRDHEVTVISYFPRTEEDVAAEPLPNYKDISLLTEGMSVLLNVVDLRILDHSFLRILKSVYSLHTMASKVCESGLNNTLAKDFVASNQKFDLVITESFNTHCFFALFHRIDAPVIEVSTHYLMPWVFHELGFSSELAYEPSMFATVPRPMSFSQRMLNVFADWFVSTAANTLFRWRDQRLAEKNFGPGVPDLEEMTRNVSLMLVSTHYSLHGPQPYPPNVVEIGGIHIPKEVRPLPKDIKMFLDEAEDGVLYFNLGSMVRTASMPEETLNVVLNVLASFPRKVIWKWEADELPKKLDNVLVKKWLPQYDILTYQYWQDYSTCTFATCQHFDYLAITVIMFSSSRWLLLCVLVRCSVTAESPGQKLKILAVFGFPGGSHFAVFRPLLEELGRRGHELTVISYFPRSEKAKSAEPMPNYKDISLVTEDARAYRNLFDMNTVAASPHFWMFNTVRLIDELARKNCEAGLNHPLVKDFVAAGEKFDLVITESFNTHCFFALFHRLDAPFVEISTHYLMPWTFPQLGFSSSAAYQPSLFSRVPKPMNFLQRSVNVFSEIYVNTFASTLHHWRDQRLAEKAYGPGIPDFMEMSRNVSLMMVNTHFSLHGAQPYPPNVVEIGGVHIPKKVFPLPKDIKMFLDEAEEGVLYFNLGSMIKMDTMTEQTLNVLMNVLGSLPRRVIWKWEADSLPKKLDNVLVKNWLPQYDILSENAVAGRWALLGVCARMSGLVATDSSHGTDLRQSRSRASCSATMLASRARWFHACTLALLACCSAAAKDPRDQGQRLKILGVFGHPGKSHFDVFKPLVEELARRGHELTVISYFPRSEKAKAAEPLANYKDISLVTKDRGVFVNVVNLTDIEQYKNFKMIGNLYMLGKMAEMACDAGLNHPLVKEFVAAGEKFDLAITESFNTHCFFALFHQLGVPFIEMCSHQLMPWFYDELGFSNEAAYMPSMFALTPRPMDFLQRMWNVFTVAMSYAMANTLYHWRDQRIAEKAYGQGVPDLLQMSKNVSLMLVNTHYSIHGAQPHPPNVVEVGGLHIPRKASPLPADVKKFLDEAGEGVLYFNLGSMVKAATMPPEKLASVINVLASLPRKVIWKWEADDLPQKPGNVLVKKWLPQFDILNHPNVKCYFGHGGLLGLSEGVHSGVPMVLMPLFGDQHLNAMAAQARGVAVVVEFTELTEKSLRHALDEVFNNTSYMVNARRLSKAFRDRPSSALETAVWWTEYIGRGNGLPYVKSEAAKMPWCVRNLVDVLAAFAVIGLLTLYVAYRATKCLLFGRKKTSSEDQSAAAEKKEN
nr:uncharacterized protein LOC117220621 [Megalopta genalis]